MADLTYEVSFKGVASPTLRAAFVDCELRPRWVRPRCGAPGVVRTVIARIEEFGLQLVEVRLIAEHPSRTTPRRRSS